MGDLVPHEFLAVPTPVNVIGRLTAFDIGAQISVQDNGNQVSGVLTEVEHRRNVMTAVTTTKVWLKAAGWNSFVELPPTTEYEVITNG